MLLWWGREGFDEGMCAVDSDADDADVSGFVLANGQSDVYPLNQTVPVDQAIEAVRHAIDYNEPDPRLSWQAW